MASSSKNKQYIQKHFNDYSNFILEKIENEGISLTGKSTKYISNICYSICNYIDFVNDGSIDKVKNTSIDDIIKKYEIWVIEQSKIFNTKNYTEKNEIILDYRLNNVGFYWVNLNSHHSSEMVFRLNNCARINTYQTILELREYDENDNNHSRVAVAIKHNGLINQIRGNYNTSPNIIYREYIYDLFLNYKFISGFEFFSDKKDDFTHLDLTKEQLSNLKNARPELFKSSSLI